MHLTSTARNTSNVSSVINRPDLGLYGIVTGTSRHPSLALAAATFAAERLEKMHQAPGLATTFMPSQALAAVHADLLEAGEEHGPELEVTAVLAHATPLHAEQVSYQVAAWGNCRAYAYRARHRRLKALTIDNTTGAETDMWQRGLTQSRYGPRARRSDPPPATLRLGDPEATAINPRPIQQRLAEGDVLLLLCPDTTHEHLYADLLNIIRTSLNLDEIADVIGSAVEGAAIVVHLAG